MKQKKSLKEKITSKEVMLRLVLVLLTLILVIYSDNSSKQVLNSIGFLVAFLISIYLHKHFFPMMVIALFFYLTASTQELWNLKYINDVVTDTYWKAGNAFLILGIVKFAWDLKFNYKIVENATDTNK